MQYTCIQCNKTFTRRKRGNRIERFCSVQCSGESKRGVPSWNAGKASPWAGKNGFAKGHKAWNKTLHTAGGKRNPRWRGGKWHTTQGYVHILLPHHPRANARGYVPEQVIVAEEYLGRSLNVAEIVHHINEIPNDNRPENLYVFPNRGAHKQHHNLLQSGKERRKVSNLLR